MVSNVQIDEVSNLAELESKRLTLLQKRAAADAKIQAARIEYLESQIRIGEPSKPNSLRRQLMRKRSDEK